MTLDELKRLAEIVTGYEALICGDEIELREYVPINFEGPGKVIAYNPRGKWNPSLTGEDWQQAQALRVIVAAFNLPGFSTALRYSNGFTIEYWVKPECKETPVCPDILSAAAQALLAKGES